MAESLANISLFFFFFYAGLPRKRGPKLTNLGNETVKLGLRDKVVLSSVDLARSRIAGRICASFLASVKSTLSEPSRGHY
jgi:hypothetical protein